MGIEAIVMLLVQLLVLGVILWAVHYLTTALPIPDPYGRVIRVIAMVIVVCAAIILLLRFIGVAVV